MINWSAVRAIGLLVSRQRDMTVLGELARQPRASNELSDVSGVDRRQLARVLGRLRKAQLIEREVHTAAPPVRVYYRVTERAESLLQLLDLLSQWWAHS